MARPPRHRIELTEDERGVLERIARAEKLPFQDVQRARIVLYAAEGMHGTEIASRLDTSAGLVGGGDDVSPSSASKVSRTSRARVARVVFPSQQVAEVKAIACELPATHGLPLGRFSRTELHRLVIERGVTDASASTIWRWLAGDAIKPWQQRSSLFVRDPDFPAKAGRVLALYARRFEGRRLRPDELVMSADEESQLQALARRHVSLAPGAGRAVRNEFDYRRGGDAGLPRRLGRPPRPHLRPLRGQDLRLIHLPIHASWLNQIEIYFSILQRKALTPMTSPT